MSTPPQKQFNVLLIGDSCIDEYYYGSCTRLSPEAPVPILNFSHKVVKPGMAANVYENLKAFDCNVDFRTNVESITKTRYIDSKTGQHLLRVDCDVVLAPFSSDIDLTAHDAIIISDYNKGFVNESLIADLRKEFKGPMFVDTKKTCLHLFDGCFIKINEVEFDRLKTVCSDLIVTLGKNGARYKDKIYPVPRVEVSDVCGAGDTFLAALAAEFLNTSDIEKAITFANAAASKSVQQSGVYALTKQDIRDIYESFNNRS